MTLKAPCAFISAILLLVVSNSELSCSISDVVVWYASLDSAAFSCASSKDSVKASTVFTTPKIAPAAKIAHPTGFDKRNVANPAAAAFTDAPKAAKPTLAPVAAAPAAPVDVAAAAAANASSASAAVTVLPVAANIVF